MPKATPTETQAGGSMLTCGLCRGSGTERHVLAIVEWSHDIHNQSCDNHIPMVCVLVSYTMQLLYMQGQRSDGV